METNRHLLYYWKDFDKNLKEGKVGWLGTKKPCRKVFAEFKNSLTAAAPSWVIAFRWEKSPRKAIPLAFLKVIEFPVVSVSADEDYEEFIYFDPRQSFRLNQPTESTRKQKFHDLGLEILAHYDPKAERAGFFGANGVQLISDQAGISLLARSESFQGNDLATYVKAESRLVASPKSGIATIPTSNSTNQGATESGSFSSDAFSDDIESKEQMETLQNDLVGALSQVDADYANRPGEDVDAIVKRRIGQGSFRSLLEKIYGESCCVSGLANKRLLIASHIVPWSKASPTQKTDPENGLLLSVCWDAVFDKGFVSFGNDGAVLFSEQIDEATQRVLGITMTARLPGNLLTQRRKENLSWHRKKHGF